PHISTVSPYMTLFRSSLPLANVYGPRNLSGPLPTFYQRLTEGKSVFVMDSRRDFVYVDDLVDVALKAVEGGGESGVYHVSSGSEIGRAHVWTPLTRSL